MLNTAIENIMQKFIPFVLLLILGANLLLAQSESQTPFEAKGSNYSASYDEAIAFYKQLEASSDIVKVIEYPNGTDIGRPLHLVVITANGKSFDPRIIRRTDSRIVLINNGIHPGEPCGVDASMILARDLVTDKIYRSLLEHVAVCIIPVYNVGGALDRGRDSRANQDGPEDHGFRGNGRLLDLNRDFLKADSRNAQTFLKIFATWQPDLFIDTHTSNGADYQHSITYIPTQKDKFNPELANYMNTVLNPELVKNLSLAGYDMCPYVNTKGWIMPPDSGLVGFLETPRYSTGLAALFNTIGYTTETHMLKPFEDRVYSTYHFLLNLLKTVNRDRKMIGRLRTAANEAVKTQTEFVIKWKRSPTVTEMIPFKGFTATIAPSQVTGLPRITYDRTNPYSKEIPFYNTFVPEITVQAPKAYVVPQSWHEVVDRLKLAGVEMRQLSADAEVDVEVYYIDKWKPSPQPYEGHWPISQIETRTENATLTFHQGDYVVYCNQVANRYVVESLEPRAHDSWMFWNFFDEILQRKEYFSAYVFEETAQKMLADDPALKKELEEFIASDSTIAGNDWAQMDFLYRKSDFYEPTHMRYPVGRMIKEQKLPLLK